MKIYKSLEFRGALAMWFARPQTFLPLFDSIICRLNIRIFSTPCVSRSWFYRFETVLCSFLVVLPYKSWNVVLVVRQNIQLQYTIGSDLIFPEFTYIVTWNEHNFIFWLFLKIYHKDFIVPAIFSHNKKITYL